MSEHTPGPWKLYDINGSTLHVGTVSANPKAGWEYESICNMFEDTSDNYDTNNNFELFANTQANARLIAAAPDMLEALQQGLLVIVNECKTKDTIAELNMRAAIAKATGKTK